MDGRAGTADGSILVPGACPDRGHSDVGDQSAPRSDYVWYGTDVVGKGFPRCVQQTEGRVDWLSGSVHGDAPHGLDAGMGV